MKQEKRIKSNDVKIKWNEGATITSLLPVLYFKGFRFCFSVLG